MNREEPGSSEDLERTLLQEIEENAQVTQRELAKKTGSALGLVNAVLRRLINRGLVKVQEVHPKRFNYFLTPVGLAERGRLTLRYLQRSIAIYQNLRERIAEALERARRDGHRRLCLYGVGEISEIAYFLAQEKGMAVTALTDDARTGEIRHGIRVVRPEELCREDFDAIIVTAFSEEPTLLQQVHQLGRFAHLGGRPIYRIL